MPQVSVVGLLLRRCGFNPKLIIVGFLVGKLVSWPGFPVKTCLLLPVTSHKYYKLIYTAITDAVWSWHFRALLVS